MSRFVNRPTKTPDLERKSANSYIGEAATAEWLTCLPKKMTERIIYQK